MKTFKQILVFVLVVAAISMACVTLNNLIFTTPMIKKTIGISNDVGELSILAAEQTKKNAADIYMLDSDIEGLYSDLNYQLDLSKQMFQYFANANRLQSEVNKSIYMLLTEQTKHIEILEKKVSILERRHLELLREVANLKKNGEVLDNKIEDKIWEGLYEKLQDGKTPWEIKK